MKKHPLLLLLLSYLQLLRRGRRTAELLEAWQRLNGLDLGLGHLFGFEVFWKEEGRKTRVSVCVPLRFFLWPRKNEIDHLLLFRRLLPPLFDPVLFRLLLRVSRRHISVNVEQELDRKEASKSAAARRRSQGAPLSPWNSSSSILLLLLSSSSFLTIPLSPPASASKLSLKAETAASERPAARILASMGSKEGAIANEMAFLFKDEKEASENKAEQKKVTQTEKNSSKKKMSSSWQPPPPQGGGSGSGIGGSGWGPPPPSQHEQQQQQQQWSQGGQQQTGQQQQHLYQQQPSTFVPTTTTTASTSSQQPAYGAPPPPPPAQQGGVGGWGAPQQQYGGYNQQVSERKRERE